MNIELLRQYFLELNNIKPRKKLCLKKWFKKF